MRRYAFAAAVVLLAACSGGSGGGFSSARDIAKTLDHGGFACSGFTPNKDVLLARDDGTCDHGSDTIEMATFVSSDQQKQAEAALGSLAGGGMVRGQGWIVTAASAGQAREVRRILGGNVPN